MYQVMSQATTVATPPPPPPPPPPSPPPPGAPCSNTCYYASDGDCDDGGEGAEYTICAVSTDCYDCGPRASAPSPPPPPSAPCPSVCASYAADGFCDQSCNLEYCYPPFDGGDCAPAPLPPPPPPVLLYELVTSGRCAAPVASLTACNHAALEVGLATAASPRYAIDDGQPNGVTFDPPFCYYEANTLKFNTRGSNTGTCSIYDQCLCMRVVSPPPPSPAPPPPPSPPTPPPPVGYIAPPSMPPPVPDGWLFSVIRCAISPYLPTSPHVSPRLPRLSPSLTFSHASPVSRLL